MDGKNTDFKFSKKHTKIKKIEILLFFKKEDTLKKTTTQHLKMSTTTKSSTTELAIDYSLIPENVPSLCVPYVFENINEARLRSIFKDLEIGDVTHIDMVPYTAPDGKKVNRVFVHLKWNTQPSTNKVRTKLLCGRDVKVIYDDPWFWRVSASRAEKTREKKVRVLKPRPRIEDDDEEGSVSVSVSVCSVQRQKQKPRAYPGNLQKIRRNPPQRLPRAPRLPDDENHNDQDLHRPPRKQNPYTEHVHIPPRERKPTLSLELPIENSANEFIPRTPEVPPPPMVPMECSSPAISELSFATNTTTTTSEKPKKKRQTRVLDVDDLKEEPTDFTNFPAASELPVKKKKTVKKPVAKLLIDDDDTTTSTLQSSSTEDVEVVVKEEV